MGESGVADDWPYSVVVGVTTVEALDARQQDLLRDLAVENSDLGDNVAVYWLRDNAARPPRAVVAPVGDRVTTGDKVVVQGWTAIRQDVWLDPETGESSFTELHAAGRLVHAASDR
jgi:hypothetical protein